jgi:hypothetical protein
MNTITLAKTTEPGALDVLAIETASPNQILWPCSRCWDENGEIKSFRHVAGGICFKCGGRGGELMDRTIAEKRAHRLALSRDRAARKREQERLVKLAVRDEKRAELEACHPGILRLLDPAIGGGAVSCSYEDAHEEYDGKYFKHLRPINSFVGQLQTKLLRWDSLSDAQAAAANKAIDQHLEREAAKAENAPAPEGRIEFTGEITSARWDDNGYGVAFKVRVVTAEGWAAWGTLPSHLVGELVPSEAKGIKVTIHATLERSADDHSFAFFKRPSKQSRWAD